ncbi:exocyst complex component 1-like isoform X2 [Convolutriloba macropyga]|uniref:exocyst complex component 1-like isoform X2 n=1 Tax=Convolutriloba macropyga TaxID=536237 RepID=UPI003F51D09B
MKMTLSQLEKRDEVKRLLQNNLFSPTNERLNGVIALPEESKKRKSVFFCITASTNHASGATGVKLVKVGVEESKSSHSNSGGFEIKRKEDILLSSVLNVNGKPMVGDATIAGFTLSIRPRGSGGQNFVLNTGDWLSGTASTATSYTKAFLTLDTAALSGGGSGSGGGMGRPTHLTVTCASREDRDYFLTVMHKMSLRYLPDNMKIQFINVEPGLLMETNLNDSFDTNLTDSATTPGDGGDSNLEALSGVPSGDDVHARELDDLQQVLMESNMSCIDAEMLVAQLSQNLNSLDGENVSMIIGSEEKMLALLSLFDASIEEIERMEASLDVYDRKLSSIRDYMQTMSSNEKLQKLESTNQKKLAKYLDEILNKTMFPEEQEQVLIKAFTSEGNDLDSMQEAANKLISCLQIIESLDSCVREKVEAVKCYYAHLTIRQNQFLDNFRKALNAKFSESKRVRDPVAAASVNVTSGGGGSSASDGGRLRLARRNKFHNELNSFCALTAILRERDQPKYDYVVEQYASKCAEQYRLDCEEFLEKVRFVLPTRVQGFAITSDKEAFYLTAPYSGSFLGLDFGLQVNHMFGSMSNLAQSVTDVTMAGAATLNPKSAKKSTGPVDLSQIGSHVIDVFRLILDEVFVVYCSEGEFLASFFGLSELVPPGAANTEKHSDSISRAGEDDDSSSAHDVSFDGTGSLNSSFAQTSSSNSTKYNLRKHMLKKLFKCCVEGIQAIIQECYMKNPVNILYLHTELINRRHLYGSASELNEPMFAEIVIDALLNTSEFNFNMYFKSMEQKIVNESKLTRPKKTGTLTFVSQLVEFSRASRDMFDSCADSSAMFNKIHRLLYVLITRLNQVQADDRSPAEVIKLENFNVLQDFLRWIRVTEFADLTAETKRCYQENLSLYVDSYVGAPIQSLKALFDEIEDRLEDGLDIENVRFMQNLSIHEMKRQINMATPKEVEKGIRALYQRVAKNLSSDGPESMTSVVWGAIQREFLQNHARHNELLHLCYSPNLNTLYTVEMINEFFLRDA